MVISANIPENSNSASIINASLTTKAYYRLASYQFILQLKFQLAMQIIGGQQFI